LRDHGQAGKHVHTTIGWNSRMDGIQGAFLSVKLRHLDLANTARREYAALYNELLADDPRVVLPAVAPHNRHVYHIYAVRVKDRQKVLDRMAERGINCAVHYPVPIHLQKAYAFLGYGAGAFPVTECCARELLSLPMYPGLTEERVRLVASTLKECLSDQPVSNGFVPARS
jgi:dTDP-4-amino-4,6-dideoxygalactose transaminase